MNPDLNPDAPFTRVVVDSYGASFESAMRGKEVAIVFEVVYPHFESAVSELLS